ncbi:MAG: hypothetical protein AAGG75_18535 [Bacteroidota bacterium]
MVSTKYEAGRIGGGGRVGGTLPLLPKLSPVANEPTPATILTAISATAPVVTPATIYSYHYFR